MTEEPDKPDPVVDPVTDEPLEQQEYRKKLQESVQEAQAHRSGREVEEEEPEAPAPPEKEWKPPEEARMSAETGRLLVRLVVFAVLIFGVYLVVQEVIRLYYAPEVQALRPVVPTERVSPETPTRVGVLVRNTGRMEGAAFVVAAFANGEEVEGPSVTLPGGDTATVWVDVPFESGDQVFALVVFDGWRDVERVTTFPGLKVEVGEYLVELSDVFVPESAALGDTITIDLTAANTGQYVESLRPVVLLSSRSGDRPVQFEGDLVEIAPGDAMELGVEIDTGTLQSGRYTADVILVTAGGRRVAGIANPIPIDVTE